MENITFAFKKKIKITVSCIIIILMINNLEHCTEVYYLISKKQLADLFGWKYADWVQSLIVILVLDWCIITWVRLNRYWEAGTFALMIFILNLLYYEFPGTMEKETIRRTAELIFSGMFTFGIISLAYIRKTVDEINLENEEVFLKNVKNNYSELEVKLKIQEEYKIEINKKNKELYKRIKELERALALSNDLLNKHLHENKELKNPLKIKLQTISDNEQSQIKIFN